MSEGLSFETFSAVIGCHRDTLYEWVKVHKAFSDAKSQASAACQLWFEKAGRQQIIKGKGSSASWIFSMKNRFKWTDRQEVSSPEGQAPITIKISERGKE